MGITLKDKIESGAVASGDIYHYTFSDTCCLLVENRDIGRHQVIWLGRSGSPDRIDYFDQWATEIGDPHNFIYVGNINKELIDLKNKVIAL